MAGLVGFDSKSGDMHGKSQLHQITRSVNFSVDNPNGVEGDTDDASTGKGALVKYDSTTPTFYTLDHTTTKSYTNPLIEYSFCFGDCYTLSGSESSFNRVGVNIFKGATPDDANANGTLIHASGSIKEDGTIISNTGGNVEPNGFGQGSGRNPSYTPVYMRFVYNGTINSNETIRLKIAATDVVQVRIRDVLLTIKDTKTKTTTA